MNLKQRLTKRLDLTGEVQSRPVERKNRKMDETHYELTNKVNRINSLLQTQYLRVLPVICIATFYVIQANAETVPGDFDWGSRKPIIYHPKFPITVTVTQQVKDKIQQSNTKQKNTFNQAVHIGNAFMQQHLDGTAYDFDPDYLDWTVNTGPLVALNGAEWEKLIYDASTPTPYAQLIAQNSHWSGGVTTEQLKSDEKHIRANRLVCSQVKLTEIQYQSQDLLQLTYETKLVGITANNDGSYVSTDKKGMPYVVHVVLNKNQRVSNVLQQDVFGAGYLTTGFLRQLSNDLANSDEVVKKGYVSKKRIKNYQEIYDIIKPAMQVCQ